MKNTDRQQLADVLKQIYELKGKALTEGAIKLWYGILEPYRIEDVTAALSQLMRTSKFLPQPSEVVDIVDPPQWPSPAEAWATYPHDEQETGAICDETQAAWASAEALYQTGDMIGTRRAFEGAYQRHMEASLRAGKRRPSWLLSIGWDAEKREQGIRAAIQQGLIAPEQAAGYLPDETQTTPALTGPSLHSHQRPRDVRPLRWFLDRAIGSGAEGSIPERTPGVEGGETS